MSVTRFRRGRILSGRARLPAIRNPFIVAHVEYIFIVLHFFFVLVSVTTRRVNQRFPPLCDPLREIERPSLYPIRLLFLNPFLLPFLRKSLNRNRYDPSR